MLAKNIRVKMSGSDYRSVDLAMRRLVGLVRDTGNEMRGPIPLVPERGAPPERGTQRSIDIINPNHKLAPEMTSLELPSTVSVEIEM